MAVESKAGNYAAQAAVGSVDELGVEGPSGSPKTMVASAEVARIMREDRVPHRGIGREIRTFDLGRSALGDGKSSSTETCTAAFEAFAQSFCDATAHPSERIADRRSIALPMPRRSLGERGI